MIDKYLARLGLTDETVTAKELNGKFVAILRHSGKSGDPQIIRAKEETEITDERGEKIRFSPGDILAYENPIYIQDIVSHIYPEFADEKNKGGKYIQYCPIPKILSHF